MILACRSWFMNLNVSVFLEFLVEIQFLVHFLMSARYGVCAEGAKGWVHGGGAPREGYIYCWGYKIKRHQRGTAPTLQKGPGPGHMWEIRMEKATFEIFHKVYRQALKFQIHSWLLARKFKSGACSTMCFKGESGFWNEIIPVEDPNSMHLYMYMDMYIYVYQT